MIMPIRFAQVKLRERLEAGGDRLEERQAKDATKPTLLKTEH